MSYSNDPTLAGLSKRLSETLGDEKLRYRLEKIRNSTTWKRMAEFLAIRREQLYTERPKTTEDLWKREGALAEVQRLLLHGPTLVLQWQQWNEADTSEATSSVVPASILPPATKTDDGLG